MNIPPPPLSPDEERKQRHLRLCARLIELAMQLTEAAALRALADLTANPAPQAETAAPETPTSPRRPTDPTLTFARLSSAVRQAMALENRIAAGNHAAASDDEKPAKTYPAGEDLRGAILHPILRRATIGAWPDIPDLAEQVAEYVDDYICLDLHGHLSAAQLLAFA